MMQIELINGQFTPSEAVEVISSMIQVKIKFLEAKICNLNHEEDIKLKESKIIALQNSLLKLREEVKLSEGNIDLNCLIKLST